MSAEVKLLKKLYIYFCSTVDTQEGKVGFCSMTIKPQISNLLNVIEEEQTTAKSSQIVAADSLLRFTVFLLCLLNCQQSDDLKLSISLLLCANKSIRLLLK